jgi:ADP-heptose:LPS heptosyltransferase
MTLVALRALGLGDLLTAVPALRALARAFPRHRRLLAAPAALAPLARMTGAVDAVIDTASLAPLALAAAPDVAVNLHGRGPESHRALLAAHPRRLIAFEHAQVPESAGGPEWWPGEHEVARWCRLLVEHGIEADPAELDLPRPALRVEPSAGGATLVHPGAAFAARLWPPERWAHVAAAELAAGRRVIVTGSTGEARLVVDVARRAGLGADAVRVGVPLLCLAALVAGAGRIVVGDTGVAHLATALGTPSVVLFGPSSPAAWGPPPERPQHVALWAGRYGDPHGSAPDAGLLAVSVEDVLAALERLDVHQPAGRAA